MAWPLLPAATALLGRSHHVEARLLGSVYGSTFVVPLTLDEESPGTVKLDRGSPARRTLDCTVLSPLNSPLVDPLAGELRAEYAMIDDTSGEAYWTPVGTFVITSASDAGHGRVKLTGVDRWQRVIDARFERPVSTSGSTASAISRLLREADDRITVRIAAGVPLSTHAAALWKGSRAEAIIKLAQSIGCVVYFDPLGVAVIAPEPSLGDKPVWTVGTGLGGTRVEVKRGVTRALTYNAVVVTSAPQGRRPVYATARVRTGRLRWGGRMGRKPRKIDTTLALTQADAQLMADAALRRVQGVARTLDMTTLPNPALEGGDVISVEVETTAIGDDPVTVWQRHMVESFTLPLGLGLTPITTRADVDEEELPGD